MLPPVARVILSDSIPCEPAFFKLKAATESALYSWRLPDGTILRDREISFAPTLRGNYAITLIQTNSAGCKDTVLKTLTVLPAPTANFILPSDFYCTKPVNFVITNTSLDASRFLWIIDGTDTIDRISPEVVFSDFGIYKVKLIAINSNGCTDTLTKSVTLQPKPIVNYSANVIEGCEPLAVAFTSRTTFATDFEWSLSLIHI